MATGLVAEVDKGNPSGQMSTSIDNCLVNIFVSHYVAHLVYGTVSNSFTYLFYGDDRVVGMDVAPRPVDEQSVLSSHFGMSIPPESSKVFPTLEGVSFCGFRFKRIGGRWRGVYKTDRILSSLVRPVQRSESVVQFYLKVLSAGVLTVWDKTTFPQIYRALMYISKQAKVWLPPKHWFFWVNGGGLDQKSLLYNGSQTEESCENKERETSGQETETQENRSAFRWLLGGYRFPWLHSGK